MSQRIFKTAVALLLACVASSASARPVAAPDGKPLVRSDHDLLKEIAAFDQKYVVEAYDKIGHHDPKWDEAARKLVHAQYEASIGNNGFGGYYTPKDWPAVMPIEERVKLANQVIDAGCDDPMVLFLAAHILRESPEIQPRCVSTFKLADQYVDNSKYIPLYRVLINMAAMQYSHMEEGDAELAPARERFRENLRQTLSDKETLPQWRAVVWCKGVEVFEDQDHVRADRIGTAVEETKNTDPWLFDTYMGAVEIQRAWKDRGNGFSGSVTELGWKGFREHLAKARVLLERATETDKTLPHAPALLVTVAMGESSRDEEKWFRKAIGRQVDWIPAYNAYRNVVQPRWNGSLQRQISLAQFMLDTDRFDTRVPGIVLDIVWDLELDVQPLPRETIDEVAPLIDEAMAGYIERSPYEWVKSWARAQRVVWLCVREDWKGARDVIDTMPMIERGPAEYRDMETSELIGKVFAMTSPQADAIRKAMAEEDSKTRLAQLKEIVATLPEDEAGAKSIQPRRGKSAIGWVNRRIAELEFGASLQPGVWTPLPIPADLKDWRIERGLWKTEGDVLIGTSNNGLNIVAPLLMPERFEFRCNAEVVNEVHPGQKAIYVFPAWAPSNNLGGFLSLSDGQGNLIRRGFNAGAYPIDREGDSATLRFRYDHGTFSAINEAGAKLITTQLSPNAIRRPAFGGTFAGGGTTWRFSKIEVRLLQ